MTLRNIAIKNIKGNLNKYVMYYMSNVIVITIFFIFANFIYNPSFQGKNMEGSLGELAGRLMLLCEFVIIIFTFVFTIYSISSFLKSREKEFGLLSMFGLTKNQIRTYVMFENLAITLASIATGLLMGLLFSKLFFLAVAAILDLGSEIPFSFSIKAINITVISFILLFQLISFISSFKIKNNNIAQLLKGARIAKPLPKFSRLKALLSVLLIAFGYIVALYSKTLIFFTMFPILLVVIIGTYLLFSQFSVFFAHKLQNSKRLYYRGINMISISQIIYKLKDNAKILFMTSILSGITLASSITVYSFQKTMIASLDSNCPHDISFVEQGLNSHKVIAPEKIKTTLAKYKFDIEYSNKIQIIKAKNQDLIADKNSNPYIKINTSDFNVISESDYNQLAKQYNKPILNLNKNELALYCYDKNAYLISSKKNPFNNISYLNLSIGGRTNKWRVAKTISGGILDEDSKGSNTIIISAEDFKIYAKQIPDNEKYMYYGYNIRHRFKASAAVTEIKKLVTKGQESFFTESVISASNLMQFLSIFLFIGTFVAIIFFIATGSILYFKMFNEIQRDRQEFIALKKMGMTQDEIKKVISIQILIIFFLPFLLAFSHAAFAVKSLGLMYINYFLLISGIYLFLQCIFYFFAKWMYMRQINHWEI